MMLNLFFRPFIFLVDWVASRKTWPVYTAICKPTTSWSRFLHIGGLLRCFFFVSVVATFEIGSADSVTSACT